MDMINHSKVRLYCSGNSIPSLEALLSEIFFLSNNYHYDKGSGKLFYFDECIDGLDGAETCNSQTLFEQVMEVDLELARDAYRIQDLCSGEFNFLNYLEFLKNSHQWTDVTPDSFSEDSLYRSIKTYAETFPAGKFYRPRYFANQSNGLIFDLDQSAPKWLLSIAVNFLKAWEKFLQTELDNKHVYVDSNLHSAEYVDNREADLLVVSLRLGLLDAPTSYATYSDTLDSLTALSRLKDLLGPNINYV